MGQPKVGLAFECRTLLFGAEGQNEDRESPVAVYPVKTAFEIGIKLVEPNTAQGVSGNSATSERYALIAASLHRRTFPGQTDAPKQTPEALFRANRIEHRIDGEIGHPNSAISVGSLKPFVGLPQTLTGTHLRSRKATRSLPTFVLGSRYCSTEARETSIAVPEDSDIFAPLVNCPSVESVAHSSTVLVNMEPDQPLPLRLVIQ